jgi:HlyD family secretion protein
MSKGQWLVGVLVVAAVVGGVAFMRGNGEKTEEIEFRYAPVTKSDLVRSISATGQVVALTTVDIRSKAGGKVVRLAVDEGSVVKKGDLIAVIDPEDTQAIFEQASADLQSANARATQAERNLQLQVAQSQTSVRDARTALEASKIRLDRARIQAKIQPDLSNSSLRSAEAAYESAQADLQRVLEVTVPQMRRDADSDLSRARANQETAAAELKRQTELFEKGFVSGSSVERAKSAAEAANSDLATAGQRKETLESEITTMIRSQRQAVARAQAQRDQARTERAQDQISLTSVTEAEKAVRQAEISLQRALDGQIQNEVRRSEVEAARAATVRSKVSVQNARVQLESTTVVAPRDGVVTLKYLEEGTIIPPGTSTFSQGTALVQISDITQLFVECAVDEADVANVKPGQQVRILAEAFPGQPLSGEVTRVNPAARTEQNITAVKVRVRVLPGARVALLPGMNATCEFITLEKKDVLVVPAQAVNQEGGEAKVRVKTADPKKPESKTVKLGETGNEGIEVLSGLNEGDEVVTAEINLADLREVQRKMQEAQQGGGLVGGPPGGGRGGMGGGRGGGRPGGGGGGPR